MFAGSAPSLVLLRDVIPCTCNGFDVNGCRDARSVRPLNQRLRRPVVSKVTASVVSKIPVSVVLTGTDAQIVRPYFKFAE